MKARNWWIGGAIVVALAAVVLLTTRFSTEVDDVPTFESPIVSEVLEEVPNAIGYMAFDVYGDVKGIAYITRELRMSSGQVLAAQYYTISLSVSDVSTDTILPLLDCLPWGMALSESAEVWVKSRLVGEKILNTVTMWADGVGYSNLKTPIETKDDRGFYLMETIEIYRLFFPFV